MIHNAIIGYPLGHTLSPMIHEELYRQAGIEATLDIVPNPHIEHCIKFIRTRRVPLTAVTIPHKETILPYLDHIDLEAREIGSVNTVIQREGELIGYNTDIFGIRKALQDHHLARKQVLVIGAGGAARAVAYYVRELGGSMLVFNRTKKRALELVRAFGGVVIDNLADISSQRVDVIINTTPVGMYPEVEATPLAAEFFASHQVVFDLIYNPGETLFLSDARRAGAITISGLRMFIFQAIAQVNLWTEHDFSNREEFVNTLCHTCTVAMV